MSPPNIRLKSGVALDLNVQLSFGDPLSTWRWATKLGFWRGNPNGAVAPRGPKPGWLAKP